MDFANRHDFLNCLESSALRNRLEVFRFARRHLLLAVAEVGFDDFCGPDYMVMGRLEETLRNHDSDAALWGRVFFDLWYCENFGGPHWDELVRRDPANVGYAIEAAYWVFATSGADGAPALAGLLNAHQRWSDAEHSLTKLTADAVEWWDQGVLPLRKTRPQ